MTVSSGGPSPIMRFTGSARTILSRARIWIAPSNIPGGASSGALNVMESEFVSPEARPSNDDGVTLAKGASAPPTRMFTLRVILRDTINSVITVLL